MKYRVFAIIVLISISFSSCFKSVKGSGKIVTEVRKVGSFTGVAASASINVKIIPQNDQRVEVKADDNIIDLVLTEINDGVLKVNYKSNTNVRNANVTVLVYGNKFTSLQASSSASITMGRDEFIDNVDAIEIKASSSGTVTANVEVASIKLKSNSSGDINIRGAALKCNADASSSGNINAKGFVVENADFEASSSGSIEGVIITKLLKANASSSGTITYSGNVASPQINAGSGDSVRKD